MNVFADVDVGCFQRQAPLVGRGLRTGAERDAHVDIPDRDEAVVLVVGARIHECEVLEERAAVVQQRIIQLLHRLDARGNDAMRIVDRHRARQPYRGRRCGLALRLGRHAPDLFGDERAPAPQHEPRSEHGCRLRAHNFPGSPEPGRQIPAAFPPRAIESAEEQLGQVVVEHVLKSDGGMCAVRDRHGSDARRGVLQAERDQLGPMASRAQRCSESLRVYRDRLSFRARHEVSIGRRVPLALRSRRRLLARVFRIYRGSQQAQALMRIESRRRE